MKVNRNNLNACYNCGTLNVTGVRSCGNCYAVQYYNCPYCQAWVDNSFASCPCCGKKLNWPRESYGPEYAFSQKKSTSTAVVILLLSVAVLSIVAFNLITNHSNPADAVTHTPDVATSNNLPADEIKVAAQPTTQYPVAEPPAMTQTDPATPDADIATDTDNAGASSAYLVPDTPQYTPINATATGTYTPQPSSYLKMMYPNWGRCSGGSCSGYYQYGQ
ncbi:MAG: zinc ribbon domain-containing protein [Dehalococcoidia bacterium]|nr:zinc ribbon domain-containing protein [Dehalococcoidia bacterium]